MLFFCVFESSLVDVIEFEWLFHEFDYILFFLLCSVHKMIDEKETNVVHEQELMFTDFAFLYFFVFFIFFLSLFAMKILVVRKHHFHVDFLILSMEWENWLINPFGIRLTYHSIGWSISKVSIFIYLSVGAAIAVRFYI